MTFCFQIIKPLVNKVIAICYFNKREPSVASKSDKQTVFVSMYGGSNGHVSVSRVRSALAQAVRLGKESNSEATKYFLFHKLIARFYLLIVSFFF